MSELSATGSSSRFFALLTASTQLPYVHIDRAEYLRKELQRHCTKEELQQAIEKSPAEAGIDPLLIDKLARNAIKYETAKVSAISAASGLPGGFAMAATVPADMVQYYGHMLRIAQKLAYLYSWPDLFENSIDELDDATQSILTIFVGVMLGINQCKCGTNKG